MGKGIYLLQETHSTKDNEHKWFREWGTNKVLFSHGTSNSRGVALMISRDYPAKMIKYVTDEDGRFIIADIEIEDVVYSIGNIYAPTRNYEKSQIETLNSFIKHLEEFDNNNTIIGGDFNLYLNPQLDKIDNIIDKNDNDEYRSDLLAFLETHNLIDIWQVMNPQKNFSPGIGLRKNPD